MIRGRTSLLGARSVINLRMLVLIAGGLLCTGITFWGVSSLKAEMQKCREQQDIFFKAPSIIIETLTTSLGSCSKMNGYSWIGGDYITRRASSVEQCCEACWAEPRCVAWSLEGSSMCWLKDDVHELAIRAVPNVVSGLVQNANRAALRCAGAPSHAAERSSFSPQKSFDPHLLSEKCTSTRSHQPVIPKRVIFAGLAYRLGPVMNVPAMVKQLQHLGRWFQDWHAVLYDNFIFDTPLNITERKITVIREVMKIPSAFKMFDSIWCGRTRTLAHLRDRLFHYVKVLATNHTLGGRQFAADYVLLIDLDLLVNNGSIDPNVLGKAICTRYFGYENWDVLCGMGMEGKTYFDQYALRPCEASFYSNDQVLSSLVEKKHKMQLPTATHFGAYLSHLSETDTLVRALSCFGGVSLYRTSALFDSGCTYNQDTCMCEHIPFNTCLAQKGYSIYIDTMMRLSYVGNPPKAE